MLKSQRTVLPSIINTFPCAKLTKHLRTWNDTHIWSARLKIDRLITWSLQGCRINSGKWTKSWTLHMQEHWPPRGPAFCATHGRLNVYIQQPYWRKERRLFPYKSCANQFFRHNCICYPSIITSGLGSDLPALFFNFQNNDVLLYKDHGTRNSSLNTFIPSTTIQIHQWNRIFLNTIRNKSHPMHLHVQSSFPASCPLLYLHLWSFLCRNLEKQHMFLLCTLGILIHLIQLCPINVLLQTTWSQHLMMYRGPNWTTRNHHLQTQDPAPPYSQGGVNLSLVPQLKLYSTLHASLVTPGVIFGKLKEFFMCIMKRISTIS